MRLHRIQLVVDSLVGSVVRLFDDQTGTSFSAPVPGNCIAPDADCKTKGKFVPNKPAFAAEKLDDLLPSLRCPPHREPSRSIAPTPIPLCSSMFAHIHESEGVRVL